MPTFPPMPPTERLERYVKADAKYHNAPVPAPMSRAVVGAFVAARMLSAGTFGEMDKLGALACFYDTRDPAGLFVRALGPGLGAADAVKRWARALRAAAWLAGPDHREAVLKSVPALLERADPRRHREDVFDTLDMVGATVSDAGAVGAQFGGWLDAGLRRLDRVGADLRQRPGTEDEQDELRRTTQSLREYRDAYAAQLPLIVAAKIANRDQPADAPRIAELVRMYLALDDRRNPRYYEWSALWMLRFAGVTEPLPPVPAVPVGQPDQAEKLRRQRRAAIADALFAQAASRREDVKGGDRRHERALRRARALRAADYFGHPLTPDDRVWLGLQKDDGTDILALRPDWEYPLPCCGNEQRSAPAKK